VCSTIVFSSVMQNFDLAVDRGNQIHLMTPSPEFVVGETIFAVSFPVPDEIRDHIARYHHDARGATFVPGFLITHAVACSDDGRHSPAYVDKKKVDAHIEELQELVNLASQLDFLKEMQGVDGAEDTERHLLSLAKKVVVAANKTAAAPPDVPNLPMLIDRVFQVVSGCCCCCCCCCCCFLQSTIKLMLVLIG
jgi:hypothetical protein